MHPVFERVELAMARSETVLERSTSTATHAAATRWAAAGTRASAAEVRSARARTRRPVDARSLRWFEVSGVVDGVPVRAEWRDGTLTCSPSLLARAQLVVALGDTFDREEGEPILATLDGSSTAVLLTIVRALSRMTTVEMGFRTGHGS